MVTGQSVRHPVIAITMGDPGGVGPEIICKALAEADVRKRCRPVVIGSLGAMERAAERFCPGLDFMRIESLDEVRALSDTAGDEVVFLYAPSDISPDDVFQTGRTDAANGLASYACIVSAARGALGGQVDAICTAPISKEALFAAGYTVPGHTELLAELCESDTVRMMLSGGGLNVVLQTIHVALARVPSLLKVEEIVTSIRIIKEFGSLSGLSFPRVAVCGLNPHAGEGGHFGDEEQTIIGPALEEARRVLDIPIDGPLPADTVFHRAVEGEFDFVLAMYHDQGLIPVKTLDFHGGVNVTLGLPIIRTSPDHGTAFGISGKGIAHPGSMISAIGFAANVAKRRLSSLQE